MCDNEQQFEYMDMYDPETNRIYREQVSMEVVEETYDSDFTNTEEQDGNGAGGGGGATGDQEMLDDLLDGDGGGTKSNETVIIIWPDRKMYEMVDHNKKTCSRSQMSSLKSGRSMSLT
ncbi:hypothetical protein TYRP_011965 [Tyrophagus putrescentiae]|nr:hypothetical protein TYRP_011965 [Tyrophagus putrescentiae]